MPIGPELGGAESRYAGSFPSDGRPGKAAFAMRTASSADRPASATADAARRRPDVVGGPGGPGGVDGADVAPRGLPRRGMRQAAPVGAVALAPQDGARPTRAETRRESGSPDHTVRSWAEGRGGEVDGRSRKDGRRERGARPRPGGRSIRDRRGRGDGGRWPSRHRPRA